MATSIIRLDGIDHWVRDIKTDGTSDGVDYDLVYVYCRIPGLRFKRPVFTLDNRHYTPVRVGIVPKCLACYASHG